MDFKAALPSALGLMPYRPQQCMHILIELTIVRNKVNRASLLHQSK